MITPTGCIGSIRGRIHQFVPDVSRPLACTDVNPIIAWVAVHLFREATNCWQVEGVSGVDEWKLRVDLLAD